MSNRVEELRKEYKMTQVRLGIELELTQETISAYETGHQNPGILTLIKMRALFHASIDYILGLSDIRNPVNCLDISEEELALIKCYRVLSSNDRVLVNGFATGLNQTHSAQ